MFLTLFTSLVNPDNSISGGTQTYLQSKSTLIALIVLIATVAIITTIIASTIINHLRKQADRDSKYQDKKYDILNTAIPLTLIVIFIALALSALKFI